MKEHVNVQVNVAVQSHSLTMLKGFGREEMMSSEEKSAYIRVRRKESLHARYVYGFVFFITNLLAWLIRDYGQKFQIGLHNIKACGHNGDDCLHAVGVLRLSLGCFIFSILMAITTFKVSKLYEVRNSWHSQWWFWKCILYVTAMMVPFTIPATFIQIYGEVARVGAGIFLLLQLLSLLDFLTWCNNHWMAEGQSSQCGFLGLLFSTIFCSASLSGLIVMYFVYASNGSCTLNLCLITLTAIMVILEIVVSLHSEINRGLLSSSIMGSYIVFLCWSAIHSEPISGTCRALNNPAETADWSTVLGFLIAVCAIVTATFSVGIDSQSSQEGGALEDDIPYKYDFFHLVFSMGAMYFAMLFINWELNHPTKKWRIDVGWASTWVKIINELLAASIYSWRLVSPVILKSGRADSQESSLDIHNLA